MEDSRGQALCLAVIWEMEWMEYAVFGVRINPTPGGWTERAQLPEAAEHNHYFQGCFLPPLTKVPHTSVSVSCAYVHRNSRGKEGVRAKTAVSMQRPYGNSCSHSLWIPKPCLLPTTAACRFYLVPHEWATLVQNVGLNPLRKRREPKPNLPMPHKGFSHYAKAKFFRERNCCWTQYCC